MNGSIKVNKQPACRYGCALLVDDSELDNFINKKMIETYSFAERIYICTTAQGAMEFLQNLSMTGMPFPEAIFVDLNMPIMDGFQLLTGLLEMELIRKHNPKLVILTSSVSPQDRYKASAISEEIIFLNKPLTKEMLSSI